MNDNAPYKVLRIVHDDYSDGDRADTLLPQLGCDLVTVSPLHGEKLPSINGEFDATIVYGGVQSVNSDEPYVRQEIDWIGRWVRTGKPFLGLCLGGQMLAKALGASVGRHPEGLEEWGFYDVHPTDIGRSFMNDTMRVYAAHNEGFELPQGAELLLRGGSFPQQAFRFGNNAYGLQFHPECTPAMMQLWLELGQDDLGKPGTHEPARQLAESLLYDQSMGSWFESFLAQWIRVG